MISFNNLVESDMDGTYYKHLRLSTTHCVHRPLAIDVLVSDSQTTQVDCCMGGLGLQRAARANGFQEYLFLKGSFEMRIALIMCAVVHLSPLLCFSVQ